MGEFGRTPKINPQAGRDHFPAAWTTVLAGGGIKGGQVIGNTGPDGMQVKDRPVSVPDLLATVCKALGVDPMGQNSPTSAGRSGSSTRRPSRSRRCSHEHRALDSWPWPRWSAIGLGARAGSRAATSPNPARRAPTATPSRT